MRFTTRLLKSRNFLRDLTQRNWNKEWAQKANFFDKPLKVPAALSAKRINIVDAHELLEPKRDRWIPPVLDDPRWIQEVPLDQRLDWKEDPAYSFSHDTHIYEGTQQACMIAKAQHFEGMPSAVERLVGVLDTSKRDLLLQRSIMLSQVWNTDMTHFPKRKAPSHNWDDIERKHLWKFPSWHDFGITPLRSCQILLRSMLRLCNSHVSSAPSLANRSHVYEPLLDSHIMYQGHPIVQRETLDCLVTSDTMLAPFATDQVVSDSVEYKVPDMWPVLPTVDFEETNNYDLRNIAGFSKDLPHCQPHTIIQFPRSYNWSQRSFDRTDSQLQASQILTCLTYTSALARKMFGDSVTILPKPISIQHISFLPTSFLITYFQLNTLDLDRDVGIKNLVWTSERQQLFNRVLAEPWADEDRAKYEHLLDFNGEAFEAFLAAYLNGSPEL